VLARPAPRDVADDVPPILPAALAAFGVRGGATGGIGSVTSTVKPSTLDESSQKELLPLLAAGSV